MHNPRERAAGEAQRWDDNILRILEETHAILLECNVMLDAIIKHLDVPYKLVGFVKE